MLHFLLLPFHNIAHYGLHEQFIPKWWLSIIWLLHYTLAFWGTHGTSCEPVIWDCMFRILLHRKFLNNHRQNKGLRKIYLLMSHSGLNQKKGKLDYWFSLTSCLVFSKPTLSNWRIRWGQERFPKWGFGRVAGRSREHIR